MKKATKIGLIIGIILILTGSIIFISAMAASDWNIESLSSDEFKTNTYEITEDIRNISIDTSLANVVFVPTDKKTTEVVCFEDKTMKHSVTTENNTLIITETDSREWFDFIKIFQLHSPEITVYLPEDEYETIAVTSDVGDIEIAKEFTFLDITATTDTGDIRCFASATEITKLESDTGSILVEMVSASSIELSIDTGSICAKNLTCDNLTAYSDTGDITLESVVAAETFSIENSTGNIEFIDCDAAEIFAETSTGEIFGTLLTEKFFFAQSSTGDVSVPQTMGGGRCELITDTGDIQIELK